MQMETILYQGSQSHRYLLQQNLLSHQDMQQSINPQSLSAQLQLRQNQYQQQNYEYQDKDNTNNSNNNNIDNQNQLFKYKDKMKGKNYVYIWVQREQILEYICLVLAYFVAIQAIGIYSIWYTYIIGFIWIICTAISIINIHIHQINTNYQQIYPQHNCPSHTLLHILHKHKSLLINLSVQPNKSPQITRQANTIIKMCCSILKINAKIFHEQFQQNNNNMSVNGIRSVMKLCKIIQNQTKMFSINVKCQQFKTGIEQDDNNKDNTKSKYTLMNIYKHGNHNLYELCTKIIKCSIFQHRCTQSYKKLHKYYQNIIKMQQYINQQHENKDKYQKQLYVNGRQQYKNMYHQYLLKLLSISSLTQKQNIQKKKNQEINQEMKMKQEMNGQQNEQMNKELIRNNKNNNNNDRHITILKLIKLQLMFMYTRTNISNLKTTNQNIQQNNNINISQGVDINKQYQNNIQKQRKRKYKHNEFICMDINGNTSVISDKIIQNRIQELKEVLDTIIHNKNKQLQQQQQQQDKIQNKQEKDQKNDNNLVQLDKYNKQRRVQGFTASMFSMVNNKKKKQSYYIQ